MAVKIHLPKKAPYLNPNERKVNQLITTTNSVDLYYCRLILAKSMVDVNSIIIKKLDNSGNTLANRY